MIIPLTEEQKIRIVNCDDIFNIMQEVLLREEKIDQEKEHFWLIGLANNNRIQNIELVSMGSAKFTAVEPMNVFRVAVIKGSAKVIMVHNHPAGDLEASMADLDTTDRLIQVGRILDIPVVEHLIISTYSYFSFAATGVLAELEKSDKWVPKFELIERLRAEEKKIRQQAVREAAEKNLDKGKKEGIRENKLEIAKIMKEKNEPLEKIMEYTGLSRAVIQKL